MTVTEAARLMKMHPATVRRWIQRGWLTATKLPNGRYALDPVKVTAWVMVWRPDETE